MMRSPRAIHPRGDSSPRQFIIVRPYTPGGYEGRIYYLCFKDSGQPYIRKEVFTPGISAGSCMGGEFNEDLPMDFLVDCDLEKFSDEFPMRCYEQILNNKELAEFIRKWNERYKAQMSEVPRK